MVVITHIRIDREFEYSFQYSFECSSHHQLWMTVARLEFIFAVLWLSLTKLRRVRRLKAKFWCSVLFFRWSNLNIVNLVEKESKLKIQTLCVGKIILLSCILMALYMSSIWLGSCLFQICGDQYLISSKNYSLIRRIRLSTSISYL